MEKFEDHYEYIIEQIQKRRNKWNLDGIAWMDFDDIVQIISSHIYRKWDMWDQDRPLGPWVNKVISSQLKNIIRNNYKNCSKDLTAAQQKRQEQKKNVKMPLSWEFHFFEISNMVGDTLPMEEIISDIKREMRDELDEKYYSAFLMLFFDPDTSDEEVASLLGYKSNEPHRKAGYKQIRNLKNLFKEKVIAILEKKDLLCI